MLRQAIGDAFRVTRNTPWTSFAIVLTLSLGTGLNAAVLALTYGIFFRPLPYRDPAALVRIEHDAPLTQLPEFQARRRTVDRVAASRASTSSAASAPCTVSAAFVASSSTCSARSRHRPHVGSSGRRRGPQLACCRATARIRPASSGDS
jgi:hypothetical protein